MRRLAAIGTLSPGLYRLSEGKLRFSGDGKPAKFVDWGPVMAPINPVNPVMLGGVPRGLVQVHSAPIAAEFDAADLPDSCALATLGRSWLVPSLAAFGEPLEVSPAAGSPPALPPFFCLCDTRL